MSSSDANPMPVWGAATAAYQIEGAWNLDGKGPSVWDRMTHWPGKIYQGHHGDIACDHYHRWEEDLDLMAEIGLQAYRFSFSWPRILPEGTGKVNHGGLDFYDRLVDGLLERGIQPWATLFHWCYPLALYHRGGWLHPESPHWFSEYAGIVADRFGDRIRNWITINEPQIFVHHGHVIGLHAPGLQLPDSDIIRIVHNVLKAHGKAARVLREKGGADCQIGWAPATGVSVPGPDLHDDPEAVAVARSGQFEVIPGSGMTLGSAVWSDPVFLGQYPDEVLTHYGQHLPPGWEGDMEAIHQPLDFCGMNIYAAAERVVRTEGGDLERQPIDQLEAGFPRTLFGWPVTPEALYWGPRFFHERYGQPIVITENGMSGHDWVDLDGKVRDPQRIDFTRRYLDCLLEAVGEGTPVKGYFHWSLMDNFEWAEGYKQRFGLIHVDYETGKRTLKESAYWYRDWIQEHSLAGSEESRRTAPEM